MKLNNAYVMITGNVDFVKILYSSHGNFVEEDYRFSHLTEVMLLV